MRTDIDIDDAVMDAAVKAGPFKSKKDAVEAGIWIDFFNGAPSPGRATLRHLRANGITVRSAFDVLLAAFCIQGGHTLLHADRDFAAFEATQGLRAWRH